MSGMKPYNQFEVAPISGAFGTVVKGFDRSEELELSQVSEIEHAVNEFHVLFSGIRDLRYLIETTLLGTLERLPAHRREMRRATIEGKVSIPGQ